MFLSACASHCFAVDCNGALWGVGYNRMGQLATGHEEDVDTWTPIGWPGATIRDVALGWHHSVILDSEGCVWGAGQVLPERPKSEDDTSWFRIPDLPDNITQVAAGTYHSAALDHRGNVWVFAATVEGCACGQLGRDLTEPPSGPTRVPGLPPMRRVSCGKDFTMAEARDGSLWAFGNNYDGQLGIGPATKAEPTRLVIPDLPAGPIRFLKAGGHFSLIVDCEGGIWTSGFNYDGQLGHDARPGCREFARITDIPPVDSISVGYAHCLMIDNEQRLWVWGRGSVGQLGTSLLVQEDVPLQLEELDQVLDVAAGHGSSMVISKDGDLYVFGNNGNGQLGLGDFVTRQKPEHSTLRPVPPQKPVPATKLIETRWRSISDACGLGQITVESPALPSLEKDDDLNDRRDRFRNGLGDGTVPLIAWSRHWKNMQAQMEEVDEAIAKQEEERHKHRDQRREHQRARVEAEKEVARLTSEIAECSEAIDELDQSLTEAYQLKQVLMSYESHLQLASEVEAEVRTQLIPKIRPMKAEDITPEDIGIILNYASAPEFFPIVKEREIPLQDLIQANEEVLQEWGVDDRVMRKRVLFTMEQLSQGVFLDQKHEALCELCQCSCPRETMALLKKLELELLKEELITRHHITAGVLVLCSAGDLEELFVLTPEAAEKAARILKDLRDDHTQLLQT